MTEQLIQKATKLGCYKAGKQHKSYVGILHDEIKIKSKLKVWTIMLLIPTALGMLAVSV